VAGSAVARLKRLLLTTRAGRVALVGPRALLAVRAARVVPRLVQALAWSVRSREIANFTYDTTRESQFLLAAVVAEISQRPIAEIVAYVDELTADNALAAHVAGIAQTRDSRWNVDPGFKPGRRLAFYLLARALKPKRVMEAGVDKGLGALLVSRALTLNRAEGHPGDYLGIELDPEKPIPLYEKWPHRVGQIVRGSSTEILRGQGALIDLFIHDTIPEAGHLTEQLATVRPLMAPGGVIASTWTTQELIDHAFQNDLKLLTHQEETVGHWFPGDRVAFIYGYGITGNSDKGVTSLDTHV
jgi:predicted O-methyltransferase YrrM